MKQGPGFNEERRGTKFALDTTAHVVAEPPAPMVQQDGCVNVSLSPEAKPLVRIRNVTTMIVIAGTSVPSSCLQRRT